MRCDTEKWCNECGRYFSVLEKSSDGRENVLMVTDVFSKFAQAYPTRDQKAGTVVQTLVEKWFYTYGVLKRIHSDQGRSFEGALLKQLCQLYGIGKSQSSPYHPEGNKLNIHRSELRPLPATRVEPERRFPVDNGVQQRSVEVSPREEAQVIEELPEILAVPLVALPQETEVSFTQIPLVEQPRPASEAQQGLSGKDGVTGRVLIDPSTVPSSELGGQTAREVASVVESFPEPVRRSNRGTAGQHTNPFHLPKSVVGPNNGEEMEATVRLALASAQTVLGHGSKIAHRTWTNLRGVDVTGKTCRMRCSFPPDPLSGDTSEVGRKSVDKEGYLSGA
ncbi:hypothetical protein MHYP_G00269200 [Metynnis hypsauchen]